MFKTIRKKDVQYKDWIAAARFYGGAPAVQKVKNYMRDKFIAETDKVDKIEAFLFNLMWKDG